MHTYPFNPLTEITPMKVISVLYDYGTKSIECDFRLKILNNDIMLIGSCIVSQFGDIELSIENNAVQLFTIANKGIIYGKLELFNLPRWNMRKELLETRKDLTIEFPYVKLNGDMTISISNPYTECKTLCTPLFKQDENKYAEIILR